MDSPAVYPSYAVPPPFSPPLTAHRSSTDTVKTNSMDIDQLRSEHERSQRAASVLSGMSLEDMEAAETLNSLQASMLSHIAKTSPKLKNDITSEYHSPQSQPQVTSSHMQTSTIYNPSGTEPLLSLVTREYPRAASLINGGLSYYKTTQSYIPGAEWTERNVGLPIAGKVAKYSGVEGGLRWALQSKKDQARNTPQTPDVEKGFTDMAPIDPARQSMDITRVESLPAYSPGDRSPPYSEHQVALQSRERQPPAGWRQQLVISTSGLGVAMSAESIRSLRFCLSWLRWANGRLGEAIQNLKGLIDRWNDMTPSEQLQPMSVASLTQTLDEHRQAILAQRIAALKADVLQTLKQVMGIVSNYAGGALPENARNLVHRHLTSLPQRFNMATAMANGEQESGDEAAQSANRVLVLAQEGLDMMTQVSRVVNDTLVSAEGWCAKLGRTQSHPTHQALTNGDAEKDHLPRDRSITEGRQTEDVKMEM